MIEVDKVSKRFGPVLAVDSVSFHIARGEVIGFLGPNGAGKSTVMRILACFFPPTSGQARVGGHDVNAHSLEVRRMIGYFPERACVYLDMSVQAFLRFAAEAKDVPRRRRKAEAERVIESCGLQDVRSRMIGHLSKGFRQRVGIAQALIHEPQVLILDEPTIGLDPEQVVEIRHLIRQLGKERTVILSTHILSEVSTVCNRIIVIHRGRVLTSEPISALQARLERTRRVRVEVDGPAEETRAALSQLSGVVRVDSNETPGAVVAERAQGSEVSAVSAVSAVSFVLEYQGKDIGREVSRTVFEHGWGLSEMHRVEPTLEDLYLKLIHESGELSGQDAQSDTMRG